METKIIDINELNDANEIWIVIPYDVKKSGDKVNFKVRGLTCEFVINANRFHDNGTSATLEISTLTENGREASGLFDSLLTLHSDCVLAYKGKDSEGNGKEEPIYEE